MYYFSRVFLPFSRKENVVIHFSSKMGRDELVSGLRAYIALHMYFLRMTLIVYYYSFKIFPRFWLVKTTRVIHHKQLLLTKNSVILNQWRQKCSPLQIIEPLTSKWRLKCSPLQIIESLTSKIIEPLTEKTWGQSSVIQQREKWPRGVYKFERR